MVVHVRVRRLLLCPKRRRRHIFREQVPGALDGTSAEPLLRPGKSVCGAGIGGSDGARLLTALAMRSRLISLYIHSCAFRHPVRRVLGLLISRCADGTAARPCWSMPRPMSGSTCYPIARPDTLEVRLRTHAGANIVARDGSATYAEVIGRALPEAVQVADRWHIWHSLCEAPLNEVIAPSSRWASVLETPLYDGRGVPRRVRRLARHVTKFWTDGFGVSRQGRQYRQL